MLNSFPIDATQIEGRFVDVQPAEFDGKQQEDRTTGEPLWSVTLLVKPPTGRSETLAVRVPAKVPPTAPELSRVRLANPSVTYWSNGDRSGVSCRAEGLEVIGQAPTPERKAASNPS